jgi:hypothetical protein
MIALILTIGRLLSIAAACGINLYATIAVLGLGIRFGGFNAMPPALVGLEQWLLIGGALALFVVEFVASAIPHVDTTWEALHTAVRPFGALALGWLALESAPWPLRLMGALAAGATALAAHSAKVGLRLIRNARAPERLSTSAFEDLAAVLLAGIAMVAPALGLLILLACTVAVVVLGATPWRAAFFAARASVSRVRGFFNPRDWRSPDVLTQPFQRLLDPAELGLPAPRLARAALCSPAAGDYRNGWLVLDRSTALFLYRNAFRPSRLPLRRPAEASVRHGVLADIVEMRMDDKPCTLHLLKDGPPAEITLGALQLVIE